MRAKLVVFPIRGRNWCFTRTIDHSPSDSHASSHSPSTLKHLWIQINAPSKPLNAKAELFADYIADKVHFPSFIEALFFWVSHFFSCLLWVADEQGLGWRGKSPRWVFQEEDSWVSFAFFVS